MGKVHHLKTLQPYYDQVYLGLKQFELRKNDRNYQVGDILVLEEYTSYGYTERSQQKVVSFVLKDCPELGLMPGYCILGLTQFNPFCVQEGKEEA